MYEGTMYDVRRNEIGGSQRCGALFFVRKLAYVFCKWQIKMNFICTFGFFVVILQSE